MATKRQGHERIWQRLPYGKLDAPGDPIRGLT
jgi:hypothetical protein